MFAQNFTANGAMRGSLVCQKPLNMEQESKQEEPTSFLSRGFNFKFGRFVTLQNKRTA
jgi:hypothetical protein